MQEDRFEDERKFAALTEEKRGLAKREKKINGELREIEERIKERWEAEGTRKIPLSNGTLSLRKEGYIKIERDHDGDPTPEEKAAVAQALKEAGYDSYVTEGFNSRSVSKLAREEHWDRDLPPELEGKIKFEPEYKIRFEKPRKKNKDAEPEQLDAVKG